MSFLLAGKAFSIKVGNPARKLVLIKLAENANDKGICWPSYKHIADQCEMSRRTVITHIEKLVEIGLLKKFYRKGEKGNSSNQYLLTLDGEKSALAEPSENAAPPPSEEFAPPSAGDSPPSENAAPPPSENAAPRIDHSFEPISEPLNKQKKETGQNEKQSQKASFLRAKPQEVKFNEFYSSYPLKKSKGSAQKAFAKINPDDSLLKSMIDAIEAQKVERLTRLAAGLFVPDWKQPATWLNSMCWEDEIQSLVGDDTPYQAITDLYNQILGEDFVESVGVETDDRKETISKLWRSMKCDLEKIKSYFVYFGDNAGGWYRGQNDRGWVANFDYICREDTITKARENTL